MPVTPLPSDIRADIEPLNIGWLALGPAIAFCSIAMLIVLARWYTRLSLVRAAGKEDILISTSIVLMIAHTIVIGFQFVNDGQIKDDDGGDGDFKSTASIAENTVKLVLTANTIYCVATSITKASIISLYLRVFHEKAFRLTRLACFAILFMLLVSAAWGVFGGIFLCRPMQKLWDFDLRGKCLSPQHYWLSFACMNVCLDFAVWVFPMSLVRKLKIPPKQIRLLGFIFCLGGFVCIFSVIRIAVVVKSDLEKQYSRSGAAAVLWSSIEANTGIVCACLLCLKPLIVKMWPSLLSDSRPPRYNLQLPTLGQSQATFVTRSTLIISTTAVGSRNDSAFKQQSPTSPTKPLAPQAPEDVLPRDHREITTGHSALRSGSSPPRNNCIMSLVLPQRPQSSRAHGQMRLKGSPKQQRSMPDLHWKPPTLWGDTNPCITAITASASIETFRSRSIPSSIRVDTEIVQTEEHITPPPTARRFMQSPDMGSQREMPLILDIPDFLMDLEILRGRPWVA